jgi:hypothetical protein
MMLSLWKESLETARVVDFSIVDSLLGLGDNRAESLGGLRLLAILLEHGLSDAVRMEDPGFFRKILRLAQTGGQKTVGVAAARCLGLMLAAGRPELVARMRQLLDPVLSELAVGSGADERARFLVVLHGVQRSYPEILVDFANHFVYVMKIRSGDELSLCLEMFTTFAPRLVQGNNFA